jgi:hypothetical protein
MNYLFNFEIFSMFESTEILAESDRLTFTPNGPIKWNSASKTFSVEASDAKIGVPSKELTLTHQGKTIKFKQTSVDRDGSGEDIYGWNYDSVEGSKFPCKLLIIND